jgi:3-dehydroquinate synthetase
MSIDKKAVHGIPKFVVLKRIGEAQVQGVDSALVAGVIAAHTPASAA